MPGRRGVLVLMVLVLGLVSATGLIGAVGGISGASTASATRHAAPLGAPPVGDGTLGRKVVGFVPSVGLSEASPPNGPAASSATYSTASPAPADTGDAGQAPLIEETGSMTLVVPGSQVTADVGSLSTLAAADGGFVAGTETQSAAPGSPAQGTVTLQVPEASFDAVISQVRRLGRVVSLSTTATDVTGQYVDLQAQITALQASRQQYLIIMTKATTVGAILSVQSQLDSLQSQLQQLQGQMKVLDNETTYATLVVTLSQKAVVTPVPQPESGLAKAWHAAIGGFVAGFEGVVRVAGPLLFALLLVGALVLAGRAAWRLWRRPQPGPDGSSVPAP